MSEQRVETDDQLHRPAPESQTVSDRAGYVADLAALRVMRGGRQECK